MCGSTQGSYLLPASPKSDLGPYASFDGYRLQHVAVGERHVFLSWYPAMMLALEASNVIDLRLWKLATGGAGAAAEGRLMVEEKLDALLKQVWLSPEAGIPLM